MVKEWMEAPVLAIVKGGKIVHSIDGYDTAYIWAKENPDSGLLGQLMGNAALIFIFGQAPLRFDLDDKHIYAPDLDRGEGWKILR